MSAEQQRHFIVLEVNYDRPRRMVACAGLVGFDAEFADKDQICRRYCCEPR